MGKIEEKTRERDKRTNLQRIILESVKTAGILSVGLLAPNVIGAMYKLGLIPRDRQGEYVCSSASKLTKRGLLRFNGKFYEVTKSGQKLLNRWMLSNYKLTKPTYWDGKWRMIIFDIPEKKKNVRKQVSSLFNSAGLYRLQDSVWVYPYDCEDIIGLMKTDFGIGKDVLYIIAEEIENDKHLRSEFKLY
jgi:DNA-binding transcriptional regulator PaaX